jgi:hypothetical protein
VQALSDDQHIAAIEAKVDRLETKIDDGFAAARADSAEVRNQILASERALRSEIVAARSDGRSDFRTLIAVVFAMWTATVLAVGGVIVAHV